MPLLCNGPKNNGYRENGGDQLIEFHLSPFYSASPTEGGTKTENSGRANSQDGRKQQGLSYGLCHVAQLASVGDQYKFAGGQGPIPVSLD
jgi:hypothetical protein